MNDIVTAVVDENFDVHQRLEHLHRWQNEYFSEDEQLQILLRQLDTTKPLDIQRGHQIGQLRKILILEQVREPLEVVLESDQTRSRLRSIRQNLVRQFLSLTKMNRLRWLDKIVGVHVSVLVTYPRVNALLNQVTSIYHEDRKRAEQALLSEDELVAKVEKVVEQLERLGKPVTQRAVSAIIGVPASSLYYYPKVIALIKGVVKDKRRQSMVVQTQLREQELVAKVMGAIEDFRASGRTESVRAIVKEVQISEGALKRYPRVKMILDQIVDERRGNGKRSA